MRLSTSIAQDRSSFTLSCATARRAMMRQYSPREWKTVQSADRAFDRRGDNV